MKNSLLTLLLFIALSFTAFGTFPLVSAQTAQVPRVLGATASSVTSPEASGTTQATFKGNVDVQLNSETSDATSSGTFIGNNWGKIAAVLMGIIDLISRLTPTLKDNSILTFFTKLLNSIIPNKRIGGGVF